MFSGRCSTSCPDGYFEFLDKSNPKYTHASCLRCHYSCRICSESFNNCTGCFSDAQLHKNGRCYAKELVEEVVDLERWYTAVSVVFLALCFIILFLVVYIITDKNPAILEVCASLCPGKSKRTNDRNSFISMKPTSSHRLEKHVHQPFPRQQQLLEEEDTHYHTTVAASTSVYCDDFMSEDDV